jgi:hypothetical protein
MARSATPGVCQPGAAPVLSAQALMTPRPIPSVARAMLACLAGLLVAMASLLAAWLAWVTLDDGWGVPLTQWLAPAGVFVVLSLALGLPLAWGVGVPLLRALCRRGLAGPWGLALSGMALAILAAAGLWLGLGRQQPLRAAVLLVALAVAGALAGWVTGALAGAPITPVFRGRRTSPPEVPGDGTPRR